MFFSSNEAYDYFARSPNYVQRAVTDLVGGSFSRKAVQKYVKVVKEGILRRDWELRNVQGGGSTYITKWYRPWDVVPRIRDFRTAPGDFGVGVEIEMGFQTREAASFIANKIKNWKYIAVDVEGGTHPIEATFPPFEYSKMTANHQPFRYLNLLKRHSDLLVRHHADSMVGTHVNVSSGSGVLYESRIGTLRGLLYAYRLSPSLRDDAVKYFGRIPYGSCSGQGYDNTTGRNKFVEYKLFNSTTDTKALRRYINIAVSLTELLVSDRPITQESVSEALEAGYNKN